MKLVLLLSFLAAASAASIGSEKCTWGPAYWCDHPLKAKECGEGATSYCIANDWAQLKVDDDSACDDCKMFIAAVKDVLNNSTVQTEILSVVKELCNKLGSEATTCQLIVDLYGMKFLEALITDLDASQVCMLLELCKSATPNDVIQGPLLVTVLDPDVCAECKQIFSDLDDLLSNKSVQQYVFKEVIEVCEQAGAPADLCKMYVNQYGPEVFQYIIGLLNGDMLCSELGVCSSITRFNFLKKVSNLQAAPCTDCKQIFSDIDDLLSNSAEVSSFMQQEVLQYCLKLGLFPNDVCQELDKYTPVFMKYIATLLDGDMLCSELGVCSSTGHAGTFNPKQLFMKLIKVSKLTADPCTDCKQIFSDLDALLSNSSVQQYVQKEVLQVCNDVGLPGDICQDIAQYVPQVLNYLVGFLDGGMICSELGVCTSTPTLNLQQSLFLKLIKDSDETLCQACGDLLNGLTSFFGNATVQKYALMYAIEYCQVEGYSKDTCTQAVNQFGPTVISFIIQHSDKVCNIFMQCPSYNKPVPNGDLCSSCKQVFSGLATITGNSTFQKTVQTEASLFCRYEGHSTAECEQFVNQYVGKFVQFVTSQLKEPVWCEIIQVCTPSQDFSAVSKPQAMSRLMQDPPSNGDTCKECKAIFSDLQDILNNETVQTQLFSTLTKVCVALGIAPDTCTTDIGEFGPLVLQELIPLLDGSTICPQQGLCAAGSLYKLGRVVSSVQQVTKSNGDPCAECKEIVMDLLDILNNQTVQKDIFNKAIAVCVALGGSTATCTGVINNYGPVVLSILTNELTPSLCTMIQLCTSSVEHVQPKPAAKAVMVPPSDGNVCTECKQMIADIKDILSNTTVQNNLFSTLTKVCVALGIPSDTCSEDIMQYGPVVVQFITAELIVVSANGNTCTECKDVIMDLSDILGNQTVQGNLFKQLIAVCVALGIPSDTCSSDVNEFGPIVLQALIGYLSPSLCPGLSLCSSAIPEPFHLPKQMPALELVPAQPIFNPVGDDPTNCLICEFLMDVLGAVYPTGATSAQLETLMYTSCKSLPTEELVKQCNAFVTNWADRLIEELVALDFDYDKACTGLQICPGIVPEPKAQINDTTCIMCEFVMDFLTSFHPQDFTKVDIQSAMNKACSLQPPGSKTECDGFVSQYGAQIITLRMDKTPFEDVCMKMNVCPDLVSAQDRFDDIFDCLECQRVKAYLVQVIKPHVTQQQVGYALDAVCLLIGGNVKGCLEFMIQYRSDVAGYLLSGKPVDMLCKGIGVCTAAAKPVPENTQVGNALECEVCKLVMGEIEVLLKKNATEKDIEKFLDNICNVLPSSLKDACDAFVTKYTTAIIDLLKSIPANGICQYLGVCTSSSAPLVQTNLVHVGSSVQCDICEYVMDLLDVLIKENATKTDIEHFLENICAVLPSQLKTECDMFVKEYVPEILQLLATFPPDQICKELGLCTSSKASLAQSNHVQVGSSVECEICEETMALLEGFLKQNTTKADIENFLVHICDILPSQYKTECDMFVKQYVPEILQLLSTYPTDEICKLLGLCTSSKGPVAQSHPVLVGNAIECEICEYVTGLLDAFLKENRTKADVEHFLDNICDILPSQYKTECDMFVKEYVPEILQLLDTYPPDQICKLIKLCSSAKAPVAQSRPVLVENAIECEICEYVTGLLDAFLKKNRTKADVEHFLDNICDILPSQYKTECDMFVKEYVPEILQLLDTYPPDQICKLIKLCSSSSAKAPVAQSRPVLVGNAIECEICEYVTGLLDAFLKKNRTKADVEHFLDNICGVLPSKYKTECDMFVKEYVPEILQLLDTYPPDQICKLIQLCTSAKAAVAQTNHVQIGSSVECEICDEVMKLLDVFLKENRTTADIEKFLDNICAVLPPAFAKQCDAFMNEYVSQMLKLLAQYPPDQICKLLGLCTSSKDLEDVKESTECILCQLVMTEVDKLLDGKTSQAEIEKVLEDVCSLMPTTIRTECEEFVKEYAPQIIQLLLQFVTPTKVCDELKLCTPSQVEAKVPETVGGIACGPCEMVAEHVEIILKEGSTQKEIEDFLKTEVCPKLPGDAQKECVSVVDKYLPEILKLVTSMTPEELCGLLGLCSSGDAMDKMVDAAIHSTAECMICDLIVKEMRTGLSQNSTEAGIQKFLDTVCSKVPLSTVAKDCQEFVNDYTKPIIQYLLAEMDPDNICDFLKVCDQSKITSPFGKVNSDTFCLVCDVLFGILETQLATNKSFEEVTDLIEKVCPLLPESLNEQCKGFLDMYGPVLLKLIVDSELSPNEICKDLGLCTSFSLLQPKLMFTSGSVECDACKELVTVAEDLVKENEDKILETIAKICDLFPKNDQQQCQNYIEVYGDYILDLILEGYLTPDAVCKDLKLCSQSIKSLPPANKCMQGPVFWCASMDNAKLCNTVEHCRRHAWN
ncbi:uncharacterized protein LOC119731463 isoform X3 [Patiria miniata]|uniref:Saposin n=1 Tax=Patiria miniata TaxID=46514 RepID=A0A914A9N4_PATMI|nr:uncharacterized protein LOC119731463 isoform X3 [Patiria miniata]